MGTARLRLSLPAQQFPLSIPYGAIRKHIGCRDRFTHGLPKPCRSDLGIGSPAKRVLQSQLWLHVLHGSQSEFLSLLYWSPPNCPAPCLVGKSRAKFYSRRRSLLFRERRARHTRPQQPSTGRSSAGGLAAGVTARPEPLPQRAEQHSGGDRASHRAHV